MDQTRYKSKSWVIKSRFSFNVRQHGQQQLYLQYKVSWILFNIIDAPSLSQPYLCIQLPLQSPRKFRSSTLVTFHLPIPPLFVHKIIFTTPTTLPSSIPHQFLTSLFLGTAIPTICTKSIFPTSTIYPIQAASREH